MERLNLAGQRFGRLVALSRGPTTKHSHVTWHCQCDCGNTSIVKTMKLRSGYTKSCGCIKREWQRTGQLRHGYAANGVSVEYRTWSSIKARCTNPAVKRFEDYGGRGIKVCKAWSDDVAAFIADMGPRPEGASIDRIDSDGDYEPSNCRWATLDEQANNKRRTIRVDMPDGRCLSLKQFARETGHKYLHLYHRVRFRGMSPFEAAAALSHSASRASHAPAA